MKIFYLDASAWVKRHQSEAGSDWMRRFWQPGVRFGCATLGLIEVLCTVTRRHANRVDPAVTSGVLLAVKSDFDAFAQVEMDDAVVRLAESLGPKWKLRGADSIHLASAVRLRDSLVAAVTLIASDIELLTAATAEGFTILDPSQDPPLPTVD